MALQPRSQAGGHVAILLPHRTRKGSKSPSRRCHGSANCDCATEDEGWSPADSALAKGARTARLSQLRAVRGFDIEWWLCYLRSGCSNAYVIDPCRLKPPRSLSLPPIGSML